MNFILLLVTLYCSIIFIVTIYYLGITDTFISENYSGFVSVIIPYRNEELHVEKLISSLNSQDFEGSYEILFINDHSNDKSEFLIEKYCTNNIKSLKLPSNLKGKKDALKFGCEHAMGDVLVFIDADCIPNSKWLRLVTSHFNNSNTNLVASPFLYNKATGVLNGIQVLEQLLIWGVTRITAFFNMPVMCNGANLAIRKSVYVEALDSLNRNLPSGDDIFLLQFVKSKSQKSIVFLDSMWVRVTSDVQSTWKLLLNQKIRWASKTGYYSDKHINIMGILFLFYFLFFIYLSIVQSYKYLFVKISFELFFALVVYMKHFGKIKTLKEKLEFIIIGYLFLFIYPFYACVIGFLSKIIKYEWKGRSI